MLMNRTIEPECIENADSYQRHIMFRNNDYEIMYIVWDPAGKSPIHNHADNGCCMLVCSGELVETRFTPNNSGGVEMAYSTNVTKDDDATYIDNQTYVHQIENKNSKLHAISLHIYSPPCHRAHIYG